MGDNKSLILLLNTSTTEFTILKKHLKEEYLLDSSLTFPDLFVEINNETSAKDRYFELTRQSLYLEGGVISITPRILIVDLLNKIIPVSLISGLLINHCEDISDTSTISFVTRMYRQYNKLGFIKAFSESPNVFVNEIGKLERMMKTLHVSNLYIYPRFHLVVKQDIESRGNLKLLEIRIPFTKQMKYIQTGLLDCMNQLLGELKRSYPLDTEDLTLENTFFKSFDYTINSQLERSTSKTRQIISDIRTCRTLLTYLDSYDSVTFYTFLETIREANKQNSSFKIDNSWLLLDPANVVYSAAQHRVFVKKSDKVNQDLPNGYQFNLEEQPKWRALLQIFKEIEKERQGTEKGNTNQLRKILKRTDKSDKSFSSKGIEILLEGYLKNYFNWKAQIKQLNENRSEKEIEKNEPNKRRRVRKNLDTSKTDFLQQSAGLAEFSTEPVLDFESDLNSYIKIVTMSKNHEYYQPVSSILESFIPKWIVMYDANVEAVRQIECYKSMYPAYNITVYFMVYENSIQEQYYLTNLRKEKEAFEKLINLKSNIVIPLDEHGRVSLAQDYFWKEDSRNAGGQEETKKIICDVREFRSSVPLLLFARRIKVIPITLEVGDYILSPEIAIERKNLSDLTQSLKSGRLYKQCHSMSLSYQRFGLLVEFQDTKSFSLAISKNESDMDVTRRLVLLCIHFPKLSILWSPSPPNVAELFEDLQVKQDPPDPEQARLKGVDKQQIGVYNQTLMDVLLNVPGISPNNVRIVMKSVKNLQELSEMGLEDAQKLLGEMPGRQLKDGKELKLLKKQYYPQAYEEDKSLEISGAAKTLLSFGKKPDTNDTYQDNPVKWDAASLKLNTLGMINVPPAAEA
ncbi:DNA repair endonuclease XPF [Terramyces sp. JEL0728]|nr:DNA repair endonuclease XPF [Terramyces sp. JEL0728]